MLTYPGYRNVYYSSREQCCKLFTWDENGKRVMIDIGYHPYVYLETSEETEHKSIFNTFLRKRVFENQFERNTFVKGLGVTRVFENIGCGQQFLLDLFWNHIDNPEMTKHPLKVMFFDIESPKEGAFPNMEDPDAVINLITAHDSLSNTFHTWGLKEYTGTELKENQKYYLCRTEVELLDKFLTFLEGDYPDILSGWNIHGFDLPYLMARIKQQMGEDHTKRFSPVGQVYGREVMTKFGRKQMKWSISGVSCIDYLELYQIFAQTKRESYKLDHIAEEEIGEQKLDYGEMNLFEFARDDWNQFVEYNIQDVNLLVKLDKKLLYLQLVRMLAYSGCAPLEAALGTVQVVTGCAAIYARGEGNIIHTFDHTMEDGRYAGGFVVEPQAGFQDYVVTFDVNSLYPNTMVTVNISPETKVGTFRTNADGTVELKHINGRSYNLSEAKFKKLIEVEQLAVSKANVLFTQKKRGIFPQIIDKFYDRRVKLKKELKKVNKEINEIEQQLAELKKQV